MADKPRSTSLQRQRIPVRAVAAGAEVSVLDLKEALTVRLRAALENQGYTRTLGNAPFVRMFVFTHGRWSDFASAFERAYFQDELTNRDYYVGVDPYSPLSARGSLTQLLEGSEGSFVPPYGGGPELLMFETRFSGIEKRLEQLASAVAGFESQKSTAKGDQTKRERSRGEDPEDGEASKVKHAVVDVNSIASAVQSFGITQTSTWKMIAEQHPGALLFAIDSDPRSFQVSEKGVFDGRANVLLSVPTKLRSGREATYSITIPTRVFGTLSPTGQIEVSEFKFN